MITYGLLIIVSLKECTRGGGIIGFSCRDLIFLVIIKSFLDLTCRFIWIWDLRNDYDGPCLPIKGPLESPQTAKKKHVVAL